MPIWTHANKYHYLNALAEIRDYLREVLADRRELLPDSMVDNFNLIATKLGSTESDWATSQKGE